MAVTDKELEEQLVAAAEDLRNPFPSVEELLPLLDVSRMFFFFCRDRWLGFHALFHFCFLLVIFSTNS